MSKEVVEKDNSIVFRVGTYKDKMEKIHFYPIKRVYNKKPIAEVTKEFIAMLPYRIDMELAEIEDFIVERYPNSAFIKYNYAYFGAYPIHYITNDHKVDGYVITQDVVHSMKDNILLRGNIFIVEASQFVWRHLGSLSIKSSNIKLMSKVPAKL